MKGFCKLQPFCHFYALLCSDKNPQQWQEHDDLTVILTALLSFDQTVPKGLSRLTLVSVKLGQMHYLVQWSSVRFSTRVKAVGNKFQILTMQEVTHKIEIMKGGWTIMFSYYWYTNAVLLVVLIWWQYDIIEYCSSCLCTALHAGYTQTLTCHWVSESNWIIQFDPEKWIQVNDWHSLQNLFILMNFPHCKQFAHLNRVQGNIIQMSCVHASKTI